MTTIQPAPAPATQPVTTTPSGLLVPTPAAGAGERTTTSGLVVVRHELSPVRTGSGLVVSRSPVTGDAAVEAAKAAHAELAAGQGSAAADIVYGPQVELAQQVRSDEIRQQAVAAFMSGDVAGAVELLSRA